MSLILFAPSPHYVSPHYRNKMVSITLLTKIVHHKTIYLATNDHLSY